jgi:integrase
MSSDTAIAGVAASLDAPLRTPISTWVDGDLTRVLSAGIPVTPINLALGARLSGGASRASVRSYAYSAALFARFLASRRLSLSETTNADFDAFVGALTGAPYADADGATVTLPGQRSPRTANNIVSRLYGLFGDISDRYDIEFAWREYRAIERRGWRTDFERPAPRERRRHGYRTVTRDPLGLPDEQLANGLGLAHDLWGESIADGDRAYAVDPEEQRGALLWRNLAILFLMRFAGARRAEVSPLDIADVHRDIGELQLVTKGRHGARERVVLVPSLANSIAKYVFEFRPITGITKAGFPAIEPDGEAVFLSHSVANYGQRISDETVRLVVEDLRPALDEPWRSQFTPHKLRHAFAYDLQRFVGPLGLSANMRHRSAMSADAYRAAASQWATELTAMSEATTALLRGRGVAVP